MNEENGYDINTGYIYQDLCHEHKELGIIFFEKLEETIQKILNYHGIVSIKWDRKKDGMKRYYDQWLNNKRIEKKPYTTFYLRENAEGRDESKYAYDLIEYGESYVIDKEKGKFEFDYFFALKLLVTDILEIKAFLRYQLSISFQDDSTNYKEFLDALLVKYQDLFKETKVPTMVNKYLEENLVKEEKQAVKLSEPIKWDGTEGQLVYLFELLRENNFLSAAMDLHAKVKKHFVDKNGKTFTALKQSKQNYLNNKKSKPKQADILEGIITKVKDKK